MVMHTHLDNQLMDTSLPGQSSCLVLLKDFPGVPVSTHVHEWLGHLADNFDIEFG